MRVVVAIFCLLISLSFGANAQQDLSGIQQRLCKTPRFAEEYFNGGILKCGLEEFLAFDDSPARIIPQRILKIAKHTVVSLWEMPVSLKRQILESGYELALEYYVYAHYEGDEKIIVPSTLKLVKRIIDLDRSAAPLVLQHDIVRFAAISMIRGLYDDGDQSLYVTELLELDRVVAETPRSTSVLGPLRLVISKLESKMRKTE